MDRIVVALVGAAFLEAMGVIFILGRNRLAKNFPPRALDRRRASPRSVAVSGMCFLIFGAIVLITVLVFPPAGS